MLCEPVVSIRDKEKLVGSIERARSSWTTFAPFLDSFRAELRNARVVRPSEMPGDVITMNSRFVLMKPGAGETASHTLVYPEGESLGEGKLSVLSPMGAALLGARAGDIVRWTGADGPETAEVLHLVYQPEAAGDDHL